MTFIPTVITGSHQWSDTTGEWDLAEVIQRTHCELQTKVSVEHITECRLKLCRIRLLREQKVNFVVM